MNVLITGGAGYIGSGLTYRLVNDSQIDKVIIYDNLSRGNRNLFIGQSRLRKVEFIQGDLLDSRSLGKALIGVDVVYHLAANVTTPFSDQNPHLFEQVNHWGTAELVNAIEKSSVSTLIYLSSASVYGASKTAKKVGDELNPGTFYGISKMRGEEQVLRLNDKVKTYIIRCGNVYGYNKSMRFDAVINAFLFDANFKKRITVHGTGEQKRSFIYITKATEALAKLTHGSVKRGTYNLVDRTMAVGEIVEEIRKLFPNLEFLFINQHMQMRELQVEPSQKISALFEKMGFSFLEELEQFRDSFTF